MSTGAFSLGLAAISYGVHVVTGHDVGFGTVQCRGRRHLRRVQFLYYAYWWAVTGRTLGMAMLGIRVVRADGTVLNPKRAVARAAVFPLSFLLCGLGFLGILVQREHRALHDLIAGTAVIYSWDARAARLRFLARREELGRAESPPPVSPMTSPPAG